VREEIRLNVGRLNVCSLYCRLNVGVGEKSVGERLVGDLSPHHFVRVPSDT
jgi:hypothetical protein